MLNTFFTSPQSEFEDLKIVFTEQCLAFFSIIFPKKTFWRGCGRVALMFGVRGTLWAFLFNTSS